MQCENIFCIYNSDVFCVLDKISLDHVGMCIDCICVSVDENVLETEKQRLLSKYE